MKEVEDKYFLRDCLRFFEHDSYRGQIDHSLAGFS
jgi:hypothetical protein